MLPSSILLASPDGPVAGEPASSISLGGPPRGQDAFTIVELLVAMSVTILLVFLLMRVFTATSNTWLHGEGQVDAYREARGALQIMARDLSTTLPPSYAPVMATAAGTTAAGPLLPTLVLQRYPGDTADATGPQNEEVYCLPILSKNGSSSLCAVGYYCQWMPDLATGAAQARAPRAFALMRQYLDGDGTFQRIKAATGGAASPSATPAVSTPLLGFKDLFARTGTAPVAQFDQLAAYIWDLRFRIDTDLNETTVPDGNGPTAPVDHSSPKPRIYDGTTPPYPPSLPPYVEIRFKALSTLAGRRLEKQNVTQADWKDSDPAHTSAVYRSIIQPNAQQFILRVPLAYTPPTSTPSPTP